jgi:diaminopimelate epimerase
MPNPHVVVEVDDPAALDALELHRPPLVVPAEPGGQNVEFVVRTGPRRLRMRVHERGVGETQSCGTGICAAVVAAATAEGSERDGSSWQVDVPGGCCTVTWRLDGNVLLSGPAVIVAELEVEDSWLAAALVAAASA